MGFPPEPESGLAEKLIRSHLRELAAVTVTNAPFSALYVMRPPGVELPYGVENGRWTNGVFDRAH